jgi:type IV secretion system protein VirD4
MANIGQIPKLEKLIATIRSREISACIVLQAQSQLKAIYRDNADTIVGNCDTTLFLGGKEKSTLKEISEVLGKELMSQDELAVMDGGKCILQLRGVRPFLSEKYDITRHPMYKYLSDFRKENAFNIEKFLSTDLTLKPNEQCDVYEIEIPQDAATTE